MWGIWWTWDMRLTTTFVLWLIFLAYRVLRATVEDPRRRARLSAVLGLLGALDVPVVYAANRVKASQHPAPVLGGGEGSGLATEFLLALLLGAVAFLFLFLALLRARTEVARLEDAVDEAHANRGGPA